MSDLQLCGEVDGTARRDGVCIRVKLEQLRAYDKGCCLGFMEEPGDVEQREFMGGDDGEDAPAEDAGLQADREEEIDAEYDDVGERPLGRVDADRVRAAGGFLEFDR